MPAQEQPPQQTASMNSETDPAGNSTFKELLQQPAQPSLSHPVSQINIHIAEVEEIDNSSALTFNQSDEGNSGDDDTDGTFQFIIQFVLKY